MARTLEQIYNNNIAGKEANSDLDNLLPNPDNWNGLYTYENFKKLANTVIQRLSASKVAVWRLIMYVVSYAIWTQEKLHDIFKTDVETIVTANKFGLIQWYTNEAKKFQLGDELEWLNDEYYGYITIDEDKYIVTQAAANVANGVIRIKVAKGDVGSLEPLTASEKSAVQTYFLGTGTSIASGTGIAPAGSRIEIISDQPDTLRLAIRVFYNPQILTNTGVLIEDGVTKPISVAITNYIQQLPFNSTLRLIDLVDIIQAVDGVENIVIDNADGYYGTITPIDITADSKQQYIANAGYIEMDSDRDLDGYYDYPLNTVRTLQFTAN